MFKLFQQYVPIKTFFLLITENLLIWGALLFALHFDSYTRLTLALDGITGQELLLITFLLALVCQVCMYCNDMYDLAAVYRRRDLLIRLIQSIGSWCLLMAVGYFFFPAWLLGHNVLLLTAVLALAAIMLWRESVTRLGLLFTNREKVLFLGTGPIGVDLCRTILDRNDLNFEVVGFLDEDPQRVGEKIVNPGVVGVIDDLVAVVEREKINRVVVALADRRGRLPVQDLLRVRLQGVMVEDADTLFEKILGRIPLESIRPSWLIFSEGFRRFRWQLFFKRCFDLVLGCIGLSISLPIMAVIALAIKLDSRGPVFFKQERVGQFGRVFVLLKFRSMNTGAESGGQPIWATENDNRVTRVGGFLRRCRLDELPQFFNIVRGDMSFVGPRPERPYFVERLKETIKYYGERHLLKPGLTGWAQVMFPYASSEEETRRKLEYDFFYIKNFTLLFDLAIIFQTAKIVIFGMGAR